MRMFHGKQQKMYQNGIPNAQKKSGQISSTKRELKKKPSKIAIGLPIVERLVVIDVVCAVAVASFRCSSMAAVADAAIQRVCRSKFFGFQSIES